MKILSSIVLLMGVVCMVACGEAVTSSDASALSILPYPPYPPSYPETCSGKQCEGCTSSPVYNYAKCSSQCTLAYCNSNVCQKNSYNPEPEVEELCSAEEGLQCVRDQMAENSCCQRVKNPRDEATVRATVDFPVVAANITAITYVNVFKHLSSVELVSYYKTSCSYVLVVKLPKVQCHAPDSLFAFQQPDGRLTPEVVKGTVTCIYRDVILTVQLPVQENECITYDKLQCAVVSAHFDGSNSEIVFDDRVLTSDAPIVGETLQNLPTVIADVLDEIWVVKSRLIANAILTTQLCNFGTRDFEEYDATALENINEYTSDSNEVVEPCAQSGDLTKCFLNFMNEHGVACPVPRPDNSPMNRQNVNVYIPKCKITLQRNGYQVSNLTGSVENFTWNKGTGILAVSLKVHGAFYHAQSTQITVHRRGQEPVSDYGYTEVNYAPLITAYIPVEQGDDITVDWKALQRAYVTTSFPEPAWFDVDPRFHYCEDSDFAEAIRCAFENKSHVSKEIFYEDGPSFFYMWLQKRLNFGLDTFCGHYQHHAQRY